MRVATTRTELVAALPETRLAHRVALVPTMGALHSGHLALIDEARRRSDTTVVSIFVNPLQFGPREDLARYPRPLLDDLDHCRARGVDVVFAPSVAEMYPSGHPLVRVDPGPLGAELEGAVRPGHFAGVLTVVAKLFGLVRPDIAVFGAKDYQQLVLVRRMAADLCLQVDVVGVETVRESGGLAMSSRNRYLSDGDRELARALSRALEAGASAGSDGVEAVLAAASSVLADADGLSPEYLALRGDDLGDAPDEGPARLLVAARVSGTRLIDNREIVIGPRAHAAGTAHR